MEAYSLDLRQRIIISWQQGQSKSAIARSFLLSLSSVKRSVKRFVSYEHVQPTVQGNMLGKLNAKLRKRLARQVKAHPDFTLAQQADWWNLRMSVKVSVALG
jgi:transposase